ncbi:hypothetical protein DFH01_22280 [Falsiroseomonas bella]|uniref:Uncharacterized protein n=2 Tax=Falsiroseomonas bella TaxID=2184016 RepID=A0A317F9F8_9PROT|nr:hypothetical protein DFH01_22280 [Falsiroseomonas bella]
MWAAAPPPARGQIAVAAAKAIYDAAKGQSELLTGSRGLAFKHMVVANARVLETLVVSLECISAPDPNLARAVWTFARDAPYGRPGGNSDIPKYWREKIDELRSEFQRSRLKDSPEVKAALAAADALGPALTSLHAAFGAKHLDGLARELVGTRDKVAELAAAVRALPRAALQDAGPIRDAFDNALAEVIGMTWTRLDQTYRESLPRAAVLRGSTTIGGHRAGGEAGGSGTGFFTAEPDADTPPAEPPAVPPPVHVDPSHVDPARLDPSREGEHGL